MSYDEIESDPLTLVLFHERLFFPLLLDHAMQGGWHELLLFLIETDKLRMEDDLEAPPPSPDVINRIYDTYLAREGSTVRSCAVSAGINVNRIKQAVDMAIPLQTIFASVCECVWHDVFRRMRNLPQSSDMWPQVRKAILDEEQGHMELLTVLSNDTYRIFYERHIRTNPEVLSCMHCWISVREMLKQVKDTESKQRAGGRSGTTTSASSSSTNSPLPAGEPLSPGRSTPAAIAKRYSSIAATGARNALLTFAGSSSAHVNRSVELGQDLEDPLEALKALLGGARKLQRNFFPISSNAMNSEGSNLFPNVGCSLSDVNTPPPCWYK